MFDERRAGRWGRPHAWLALAAAAAALSCAPDADFEWRRRRAGSSADAAGARAPAPAPPGQGSLAAGADLALLTWNVEWFQDPERGPSDDARQFEAVHATLAALGAGIVGLQEIAVPDRLQQLVALLPGYATAISSYEWPQQTALLYLRTQFELIATRQVTGLDDAGRPPLEVELRDRDAAVLRIVVVHAKAGVERASWEQRERFARGLKRHLDARADALPVIVLGDFNDRLAGSIVHGAPSPYAIFGGDSGYVTPTAVLERGPEASTVWGSTVDHIVLSESLRERVRPESVDVLRDELLAREPDLLEAVSDHVPVTLRLAAR